jgi:hypothetical protein
MKRIKTKKEVGAMRKVVAFISALMLGVMVSVCSAESGADRLVRDRDMLGLRVAEVASQVGSLVDKVGEVRSGKKKEELLERLMLLETEAMLLSEAFGRVDKIVFGIDVLASVVASGGYLSKANYQASAAVFDKAVKEAEDSLRSLVNCSFCSIRTREVAERILEDLYEWWR